MSLHLNLRSSRTKGGLLAIAAALFTAMSSATMHADPITYDFSLTPDQGSIGGSGSFLVNSLPVFSTIPGAAVNTTYSGASLEALSFNIGGQTFSLAGDPGALVVLQTLNGVVTLNDITFSEELNSGTNDRFDLQTSNPYRFSYNDEQANATGFLTGLQQVPSTSPVPEPGSLALLATGLLGGAGNLYRRFAGKR